MNKQEINQTIAKELFNTENQIPNYTDNFNDTQLVIAKIMQEHDFNVVGINLYGGGKVFVATAAPFEKNKDQEEEIQFQGQGDTMLVAVCNLALEILGHNTTLTIVKKENIS